MHAAYPIVINRTFHLASLSIYFLLFSLDKEERAITQNGVLKGRKWVLKISNPIKYFLLKS